MDRKRFENWLKTIYETREEEISCTECFDLVLALRGAGGRRSRCRSPDARAEAAPGPVPRLP